MDSFTDPTFPAGGLSYFDTGWYNFVYYFPPILIDISLFYRLEKFSEFFMLDDIGMSETFYDDAEIKSTILTNCMHKN